MRCRFSGLGAALWLSGCAASLSSFRPAHVAETGNVQMESGIDISYPSGGIADVIDAAEVLEDLNQQGLLTAEESSAIVKGAGALGLNPPALIPHVGVATGALEHWEAGARLATSGWRLSVRRQLLYQQETGVDFSLGLGFGTSLFTPPIERALSSVSIENYGRWNLDVPMAFGRSGSWYRWWGGPRLLISKTSQRMAVTLSNDDVIQGRVAADGVYLGGYAGAALGYESVFVGPELVVVELLGRAEMTVEGHTFRSNMNGLVVHPGFAVMGEF